MKFCLFVRSFPVVGERGWGAGPAGVGLTSPHATSIRTQTRGALREHACFFPEPCKGSTGHWKVRAWCFDWPSQLSKHQQHALLRSGLSPGPKVCRRLLFRHRPRALTSLTKMARALPSGFISHPQLSGNAVCQQKRLLLPLPPPPHPLLLLLLLPASLATSF